MDNPNYDSLKLENQLCFPLYAAARAVIKKYTPYLERVDLTYTQYIAMLLLWENKTMTVKEIGDRLYLDSGTLTPMLKKLEAKGLITRARSQIDERNLNVTLTEAGEELRERALEIPVGMAKCSSLEPDEAQTLYRLLYKMLGTIGEQDE